MARKKLRSTTHRHTQDPAAHTPIASTKQIPPTKRPRQPSQAKAEDKIIPTTIPLKEEIGKSGLMWPRAIAKRHKAAKLLEDYSTNGCPVDIGDAWSREHIIQALKRGPHKSAKEPIPAKVLREETMEKVKEGYAKIVRWKDIMHNTPKNLKISPVAMIPHKSRLFRAILDISFQLKVNGKKLPSVNIATVIRAPQKAMAQLGSVLKRIIYQMGTNFNPDKPFMYSKVDIKDGFWRLMVNAANAWHFCYVLPPLKGKVKIEDIEIVVPNALQMGWCESPPLFCTATETARDVVQTLASSHNNLPLHPLESYLLPSNYPLERAEDNNSITLMEVYVDDFIGMTNNPTKPNLEQWSRAMLHGIHSIFPPPSVTQHTGGDPVSLKKLMKEEGRWETEKEILGWMFNGTNYTLYLPEQKISKIKSIIKTTCKKKVVTLNDFQKLAGKLVHASMGIPKGAALLSPIYKALQRTVEFVTITDKIRQCLVDWRFILQLIHSRPTSVLELTPQLPWFIGYSDACNTGVGGVWTDGARGLLNPIVWRLQWPEDITNSIVSDQNPDGSITINDLELAGVLLAWLVLEVISPLHLKFAPIGIRCDNASTVAWASKLNCTSSLIAGHLLKALATRLHVHQAAPLLTVGIPGIENTMADVASRSFIDTTYTKSNKSFLQTFSDQFPLKTTCWKEFHICQRVYSRVISCLRGEPLTMASWLKIPRQEKNIGLIGNITQHSTTKIHTSKPAPMQNKSSSSWLLLLGSGQATTEKESRLPYKQLLKRLQPSPRPANWLENLSQSSKQKKHTKSQWDSWWKGSDERTHQQHHN